MPKRINREKYALQKLLQPAQDLTWKARFVKKKVQAGDAAAGHVDLIMGGYIHNQLENELLLFDVEGALLLGAPRGQVPVFVEIKGYLNADAEDFAGKMNNLAVQLKK